MHRGRALSVGVWLLIFAVNSHGAPPLVLTNLLLEDFVEVLNDDTPLQVNVELANRFPEEQLDLDTSNLRRFRSSDVRAALSRATNYTLITNGSTLVIVPVRRLSDPKYELNYTVDRFAVTNLHPFVAAQLLARQLPFYLECEDPFPFTKAFGPEFEFPHGNWESNSLKSVSLAMQNASLRQWLCALFNGQRKAYWVLRPVRPPWPFPRTLSLEVHCPEEFRGHQAFERRDPEVLRREEEELKEWAKTSSKQNIVVNAANRSAQPFIFSIGSYSGNWPKGRITVSVDVFPRTLQESNNFVKLEFKGTLVISNVTAPVVECRVLSRRFEERLLAPGLEGVFPTVGFFFSIHESTLAGSYFILEVGPPEPTTVQQTKFYRFALHDFVKESEE